MRNKLDIYLPDQAEDRYPVFFFIYSGGFFKGVKPGYGVTIWIIVFQAPHIVRTSLMQCEILLTAPTDLGISLIMIDT